MQDDVVAFGKLADSKNQSDYIQNLWETYNKYFNQDEFPWNEILKTLTDEIGTVIVREVHQKTTVPLEYRKDIATNEIVIGGTSLARGYTLERLKCELFFKKYCFL